MKFTLAPLALAMVMATAAFAQDTASTSAEATSASATSSAAAEPTSAAAEPTSAAADSSMSVCPLLPGYEEGDPQMPFYGCTYSSTSTPPYDSMSLAVSIRYLWSGVEGRVMD